MKRVLVVGSPGSGKSTFSKKLHKKTKLPIIHLDYYHLQSEHNYQSDTDAWIMDGNYAASYPARFTAADTIVFFDIPRRVCLWRILKRYFYYQNRTRDEMPEDWQEKLDPEFLKYVWRFNKQSKPKILVAIQNHKNKDVLVFKNSQQAEEYLKTIK
jgi:adenylate kinase family enzyme